MPHRYREAQSTLLPYIKLRPCAALIEKLKEGYRLSDFKSDLMSGVIVGMVAIPLGMALAIASGVAPQNGLYTVIIGGGCVALLGGSRFQVTGPTAAFVVILAPIVARFGFAGLLTAGLMAGLILVIMGVAKLGRFIQFIPYPVTTGFTAGIAVVIATIQLKDFFGLHIEHMPEGYFGRVIGLFNAKGTWSPIEFAIGSATLFLLIIWPRINKKIPAPLVVLSVITVVIALLKKQFPDLDIATIGNRFSAEVDGSVIHGIPPILPRFHLPWANVGSGMPPFNLNFQTIESLMPSAFAIAMLGAIESLLSAVVADGMAQTRHDPDAELVALGIGNIVCPFFGGIAATGAIARTATNIRFGARSPLSAIIHAIFTLLVILVFAPLVSYLPMAALAALLMLVAYNMSEVKHFGHILKVAPRSDVTVLLLCFGLTVTFDMVVGVTVGIVLAAILFMNRMASLTSGQKLMGSHHFKAQEPLPSEIMLYEISGPFFFGAAESAISALRGTTDRIKAVIFLMENVPVMDVTGLVAFESTVKDLRRWGTKVFVVGLRLQPATLFKKSELVQRHEVEVSSSLDEALIQAKSLVGVTSKKEVSHNG